MHLKVDHGNICEPAFNQPSTLPCVQIWFLITYRLPFRFILDDEMQTKMSVYILELVNTWQYMVYINILMTGVETNRSIKKLDHIPSTHYPKLLKCYPEKCIQGSPFTVDIYCYKLTYDNTFWFRVILTFRLGTLACIHDTEINPSHCRIFQIHFWCHHFTFCPEAEQNNISPFIHFLML